jgi:glycerol-3-phosphate acyltransferase PlsY
MLIALLVSTWYLVATPFFLVVAILETVAYAFALMGLVWKPVQRIPLVNAASAFLVLNTAAAIALFSFLRHRKDPTRIWSGTPPKAAEPGQVVTKSAQKAG